jgi:hypothetical protein
MTSDEIIEVVTAFKNGQAIECANRGQNNWGTGGPTWNFAEFDYRVKPREWTIHIDPNSGAPSIVENGEKCPHCVKVREVLDGITHST